MLAHRLVVKAVLILLVLATACGDPTPPVDPTSPSDSLDPASSLSPSLGLPQPETKASIGAGDVNRSILSYDDLMFGFDATSPVDEGALARPDGAAPPSHIFEGRLVLSGEDSNGDILVLQGSGSSTTVSSSACWSPSSPCGASSPRTPGS